jgi:hypothetical protein
MTERIGRKIRFCEFKEKRNQFKNKEKYSCNEYDFQNIN